MENKVLKQFSLNEKTEWQRGQGNKVRAAGQGEKRQKERKKKDDKRTLKSILLFCQVVSVCFQLPWVLALPLYYYFSVSIVLIAQPRCSREPGCHSRLRLFSPTPGSDLLPPFCPGSVLVSDVSASTQAICVREA